MNGIPVLTAEGESIAEAWENSLIELHRHGCDLKTQYDKPEDPPSKDATMILTVRDPASEPMIHRDFPGGFEELQEYVMEVCDGIKDHCVRDPDDETEHALGVYVPPAIIWLPAAHSRADRPDRKPLPQPGQNALYSPGTSHHLEGLGRQQLLRPGLLTERLVPHHRARWRTPPEHERSLPQQRRV